MNSFIPIVKGAFLIKDMTNKFDFSILNDKFERSIFKINLDNVISCDLKILDDEKLQPLKQIFSEEASEFLKNAYRYNSFEKLNITNSWLNKSEKGQKHHKHIHPYSVVSGVFFMDDNVENLNFAFNFETSQIPYTEKKLLTMSTLKEIIYSNNINPAEFNNFKNHVLLFLSNIQHEVLPIETDNVRRSMAFNSFFQGFVGDPNNPLGNIVY